MAAFHNVPTEHDLELLSAYLDGELTEREREALEQRLAHEETLRRILTELRETVAMVRDLPHLKAPRDFTLDPALYGQRSAWWKQFLTLPMMLQVSGALGTAAALVLIVLGLFTSTRTSQMDSAGRESGNAPAAALLPTSTETPTQLAATGTPLPSPTVIPQPTAKLAPAGTSDPLAANQASDTSVYSGDDETPDSVLSENPAMMPLEAAGGAQPPAPGVEQDGVEIATADEGLAGVPQAPEVVESVQAAPMLDIAPTPTQAQAEEQAAQMKSEPTEEVRTETRSPQPAPQEETQNSHPMWPLIGAGGFVLVLSLVLFWTGRKHA